MRASLLFILRAGLVFAVINRAVYGQEGSVGLIGKGRFNSAFLEVEIGGQPFTRCYYTRASSRPFFWPLRTRNGRIISRAVFHSTDRLLPPTRPLRGLSFAVDRVNGIDYWSERGWIIYGSLNIAHDSDNPNQFKVFNIWLDKQRERVLTESTTVTIYANRLIAYDATLAAPKTRVTFGETTEGLFGLCRVPALCESAGGTVVSSDGHRGTSECERKPFDWVDCYGPVKGTTVGVALFDNPRNVRRSRYEVRDDGLFAINPFDGRIPDKPVSLEPGAHLRLRYGLYVHDGDAKAANVANVYRVYVAESRD